MTVVNEKRSFKEKIDDLKWDAKQKYYRTKDWCRDHTTEAVGLATVLISGSIELIRVVSKNKNNKEEKQLKENYIYDRSAGHYYELKRQPKSSEWLMIDHRKAEGECLGDILSDMRILK
jgi:hypothetical protein